MKMKFYLRLCSHFLVTVIFAFVLASLFHSQFVMAELTKIGIDISLGDRLSMSIDDLIGLYPVYATVVAASLFFAFMVASLLIKKFNLTPLFMYFLAGGMGIAVALFAMQPVMEITILAGARTSFGIFCQSLAGAVGGIMFAQLRAKHYVGTF